MTEAPTPVHVLHVEDEADVADLTATWLEREDAGLAVESVTTAEVALERLREDDDVDCVVSDYDLPGMDGLAFLDAVRADFADLPVILFTGKGSEAVASDAISAGVTDYLQKAGGAEQYAILANRIRNAVNRRLAQANYREMFEKVPDGITLHDPADGTLLDANQQFCEMLGYTREELLAVGFGGLHVDEPPYTSERARRIIQRAATEGPQTFEWVDRTKDGDEVPVEVHLRRSTIDGEHRILAVVRDISSRKAHQQAMERQHERMEFALEATGSYIYEIDLETGEERRYGDWEALHGVTADEVPTTEAFIERAVHPADRDRVRQAHDELHREPGDPVEFEFRTNPQRGAVQWLWSELAVRDEPDGGRRGLGLTTDVSDRKAREQALQRQNERLDEFVSVVSHDLRNPLAVAQGRLEMGESEDLEAAARALDRMAALIEDLLALARDGGESGSQEPVSLQAIAEECWQTVETAAARLEVETDRAVLANPSRLRQLLENLVRNAIQHGGDSVTITVGLVEDGFYVEDDGVGLPAAADRVFDLGYSTSDDGTGFGLAIVRDIAQDHGWSVTAADGPSGGARFTFGDVVFADPEE